MNFAATATDNCAGTVVTYSQNPGSLFAVGTTTVTATATDASNNVSTCTFTVTVNDTELPTISCAANIEVCSGDAITIIAPSVSDNCGIQAGSPVGVRSDALALNDPYPAGVTTITWTVTDVNGNTNNCLQTVTVNPLPAITIDPVSPACFDAAAIQLNALPAGGTYSGTGVTAGGLFTPSAAGTGTHTITYTYTNGNGCTGSGTIDIEVKPVPAAPTVTAVNNGNGTATLTASNFSGTLLWNTTETTTAITVSVPGTYSVTQTVNGCTSAPGSATALVTSIADAATGQLDLTDLADVSLNANTLVYNDVVKLKVPIYNLNQDNALPAGSSTVRIDLGSKYIVDPAFTLATAPLNAYFNWTQTIEAGHVVIYGDQYAEIPADFVDMATFQIKGFEFCSSSIAASFKIDNHASVFITSDEDLANDNAVLLYTVVLPAPTVTVTQTSCATATGTITINAPMGAGLTYSIDGVTYTNTTGVFTLVNPGTYNVTAKATSGCISAITIAVVNAQPATPGITLGTVVNNTCHGGNNGSITVTSNAIPTFSYTIAGPTVNTTGQTSGVFTGLTAGTYTITVLSGSGCSNSVTAVVTEPTGTLPDISLGSDYTANFFAAPGIENTIVYNVAEIAGNAATGDTIRITKVSGYTLSFDGLATSATIGATTYTLNNSKWKMDISNPSFVSLIYDPLQNSTPGTLSCGERVYVAVKFTRVSANVSTFSLSARLRKANAEVNLTNNLNSIVFTAE